MSSIKHEESPTSLIANNGDSPSNCAKAASLTAKTNESFEERSIDDDNNNATDISSSAENAKASVEPKIETQEANDIVSTQTIPSIELNDSNAVVSNVTKKRPYRRTKRPAGYNDKSSVTTTTNSMYQCPLNVYDAVLQESQDLLLAAQEAQQLGRLKMTSAYLLLLHARLVGLGKRFDRANQLLRMNGSVRETNDVNEIDSSTMLSCTNQEGKDLRKNSYDESFLGLDELNDAATSMESKRQGISHRSNTSGSASKTTAVKTLAKWLPSNIELDTAMIEHLAKAAAELHAARSGRTNPNHLADGTLPTVDEFLSTTAKQGKGAMNVDCQSGASSSVIGTNNSIVWAPSEVSKLNAAIAKGKDDPKLLMKLVPGKSEQQVRAYLRNQVQRARIEADLELPEAMISEGPVDVRRRKKQKVGTGKPFPSIKANSSDDRKSSSFQRELGILPDTNVEAPECDNGARKKKGGRGKKPQTTAIYTVPNSVCDARALMKGFFSN